MEKYLTTEEVAEIARTVPGTVRYWQAVGRGPRSIKKGRRRLYPQSAVEEWLNSDEAGAAVA